MAKRQDNAEIKKTIRRLVAKGMTDGRIADALGEDRRRVSQFRRRMHLACNGQRNYRPCDLGFLREHYRELPTPEIAARLGRTVTSVYQAAARLGLMRPTPRLVDRPGLVDRLKALHGRGWSYGEIGRDLKVDRHHVASLCRKLGLPDHGWTEHMRANVRRKTAEQLRKAGLPSIGYLRVAAFRTYARDRGWPEDLKKRQVQILELLWANGPMTRDELGKALGLKKKARPIYGGRIGYWYPMHCNNAGHY